MAVFSAQLLLALAAPAAAADFVWTSEPYYYTDAALPPGATSTCCGSELVSDPAIGRTSYGCSCDLTAGVCDDSCCCDPDCTATQKLGVFGCTSNATANPASTITMCSDQLFSSNLGMYSSARDAGWSVTSSLGGADGALCIVKDNSPARGAFFRDPVAENALTSGQVALSITQAVPVSYSTFLEPTAAALSAVSNYALGAPILGDGCLSAASAAGCNAISPVRLPARAADGTCDDEQPVGFLHDVPAFGCALRSAGSSLAELCAGRLNASFLNQAAFAAAPSDTTLASPASLTIRSSSDNGTSFNVVAGAQASTYDGTQVALALL